MRLKTIYTTFAILLLGYSFLSLSGGRTNRYAGAPGDTGTCSNCHNSGTGGGSVAITGAPATYSPGVSYPITLTITDNDAAIGGFQIVATNGTTNAEVGTFSEPAGTELNNVGRLVQNTPKSFAGGEVSWTFDWIAPSTGAPALVKFHFAGNAADGTGNTANDFGYNGESATFPLPVELSQFDVTNMDDKEVKITWQTRSETGSDRFEIERSIEGDEHEFKTVGQVLAAGTSVEINNYSFIDDEPIMDKLSYYRLKQIDEDGSFNYSSTKSINLKSFVDGFSFFPNPLKSGDALNVTFPNSDDQNNSIRIFDMKGQLVYNSIINTQDGNNTFTSLIPDLSVGVYLVSFSNKYSTNETKKLIVTD